MYLFYLVIILLSSAGMLFILAAKFSEIKTGEVGFFVRLSASCDPTFRHHIEKTRLFLSHFNGTNAGKVFTIGAHKLFHIFGIAGLFVSKYYKRLTNRVNGKRALKNKGVVSFFLKNMSESKPKEKE